MSQKSILGIGSLSTFLGCYWCLLFIGTHVPKPPTIHVQHADKLVHFVAFAGLAGLCAAIFCRQRFGVRDVFVSLFCLVYAGIDELSQIPAGRTADIFDWLADFAGILLGVLATRVILGRVLTHPRSQPTQPPTPRGVQQA